MSTLAQRTLFSTLLLGSVFGLLAIDRATDATYGFLVLVLVFTLLGWAEYTRLLALRQPGVLVAGWGVLCGGLILLWGCEIERLITLDELWKSRALLLWPLLLPTLLLPRLIRQAPSLQGIQEFGLAAAGVVYLGVPIACCLSLRGLDAGPTWILLLVLVVKGNDIGAYLTGRKIGRTPLSPVSPNKTVEGSLGGLTFGIAVSLLFASFEGSPLSGWGGALLLGVLAGAAGQLGDLSESLIKRAVGVKDSGSLVPTFGGALDILDSLLFGAPVLWLLVPWIGKAAVGSP